MKYNEEILKILNDFELFKMTQSEQGVYCKTVVISEYIDRINAIIAKAVTNGLWINISDHKPPVQTPVYVICKNESNGKITQYQTMAQFIPHMTVKEDDFMDEMFRGEGDYNEDEDEYYAPEGFYEYQTESDIHWKITSEVIQWMPLISFID